MKTNVEFLKEEVEKLKDQFVGLKKQLKDGEKWDSVSEVISNIDFIGDFIIDVILAVEIATSNVITDIEGLKSEDKLNAAVAFLDDNLKFPWYLEIIDGPVFKMALSLGVYFLNKRYGSNWNLDIAKEALEKGVSYLEFIEGDLIELTDRAEQ